MLTRPPPTFGALLKGYRLAAGLSQEALAEQAGLSAQAISALERGARQAPRRDTVALLARALRLPLDGQHGSRPPSPAATAHCRIHRRRPCARRPRCRHRPPR